MSLTQKSSLTKHLISNNKKNLDKKTKSINFQSEIIWNSHSRLQLSSFFNSDDIKIHE